MKKLGLLLIAATALCSACTMSVPHSTGPVDISNVTKEGRASCKHILGFPTGDCSIKAAAEAGGVTEILYIDQTIHNYLFVITTETIVYGR